jgi:hypothetical protein
MPWYHNALISPTTALMQYKGHKLANVLKRKNNGILGLAP